jgi:hypothetical protein
MAVTTSLQKVLRLEVFQCTNTAYKCKDHNRMAPGASSGKAAEAADVLKRKLIFVSGKGGVGKTAVSQALALALSRKGRTTLWATFEDPFLPRGELLKLSEKLFHLNVHASAAFEEYIALRLGSGLLTRLFVQNKLIRYLSQAAPGLPDLLLLGKLWHERDHYDHLVVDMPSTGYGLAMFQSTQNFARLFKGGPIHRDAEGMLETFGDLHLTGHLVVSLPEEMPLQESLELSDFLLGIFPRNHAAFLLNRKFPRLADSKALHETPDQWKSPVPASTLDYARKRSGLEEHNLRLWSQEGITWEELPFLALPLQDPKKALHEGLAAELGKRELA